MTALTEHFTLEELVGSTLRPASAAEVAAVPVLVRFNLAGLAALLERVRQVAGTPLQVTSGYRDATENAEVGGVKSSQHLQGAAADVLPVGRLASEVYQRDLAPAIAAGKLGSFGQIIVYPVKLPNGKGWSHLHISTTTGTSSALQVLVAVPNQAGTDTAYVSPAAYFGAGAGVTLTATAAPDFGDVVGSGSGGTGPVSSSSAGGVGGGAVATSGGAGSTPAQLGVSWSTVLLVLLLTLFLIGVSLYGR